MDVYQCLHEALETIFFYNLGFNFRIGMDAGMRVEKSEQGGNDMESKRPKIDEELRKEMERFLSKSRGTKESGTSEELRKKAEIILSRIRRTKESSMQEERGRKN